MQTRPRSSTASAIAPATFVRALTPALSAFFDRMLKQGGPQAARR